LLKFYHVVFIEIVVVYYDFDKFTVNLNIHFIVQDPGSSPAKRIWTSIDTGTEIFVSDKDEVAEWTISDFDVILTKPKNSLMMTRVC
jgi:hypothetical protein